MRNLFPIIFLLIGSLILGQTYDPILQKKGKNLEELIPKKWNLLDSAMGDLNQDGVPDLVFVVQNIDAAKIEYLGYMDKAINLNPRVLGIYFGSKNGIFIQKSVSKNFILLKDSPNMAEPLTGIEISDKGVLNIAFELWYSMGSWGSSNKSYKFIYQDNAFQLIGFDMSELNRGSGEMTNYSINFLTHKMKTVKGNMAEDDPESEEWKSFMMHEPITLKSLDGDKPSEFQGIYL